MKKKNRPSVPEFAVLTIVYKGGGVDTFKRYGQGFQAAEIGTWPPLSEGEVWAYAKDEKVLGWVVVDQDGTVTIGPQ